MPEQVLIPEKNLAEKPFPWRCPKCRQPTVTRVTMPYRCLRTCRDRIVTVEVPNLAVPRCSNCGELVFDYAADEQIRTAFRTQFGPAEMDTSEGQNHRSERSASPNQLAHKEVVRRSEVPPPDKVCYFKTIGFTEVGRWTLSAEKLSFTPEKLNGLADTRGTLYAFLMDGAVMYIGETGTPLRERLGCYKNGKQSTNGNQSTNGRIKGEIQTSLKQGKDVQIWVLDPEVPLLRTGECQLSLAAELAESAMGDPQLPTIVVPVDRYLLEDILTLYLMPPWNIGTRKRSRQRQRRRL